MEGTPFVRNVNTRRVHLQTCNVAGQTDRMSRADLAAFVATMPKDPVTAECCGATPGWWLRNHPEAGGR